MKPITEKYLIELKLPKRAVLSESIPYNEYSIRDNFNIYCYMDTSGNCLFWAKCIYIQCAGILLTKCDNENEFKNIVKVLTGNKLVIK